jgi:hypothetical protein
MGLVDAELEVGMVELVGAHPRAVARLSRIDGIGALGERVTQGFEGAGRGQQFSIGGRHGAVALDINRKCADFSELIGVFRRARSGHGELLRGPQVIF